MVQQAGPEGTVLRDVRGISAFFLIVLLLGMNFVMVRFSNRELDPFWGATFRFAIACVVLGLIVLAYRRALPRGAALVGAVLFGVLAFGVTYGLLYWGMVRVTAGMAAVLFATTPLSTLFFARIVRIERLSLRGFAGALLAVLGIAVIFHDQVGGAIPPGHFFAVLVATLAGAAAGVVIKKAPRADPFGVNLVALAVGAGLLAIATGVAHADVILPHAALTWFSVAWLVMSTVIAWVLMVWLIGRWTASRVSYAGVMAPIVAVVGGAVLANEVLGPAALIGAAIVLVGVYVGALRPGVPAALPPPVAAAPAGEPPAPRVPP